MRAHSAASVVLGAACATPPAEPATLSGSALPRGAAALGEHGDPMGSFADTKEQAGNFTCKLVLVSPLVL